MAENNKPLLAAPTFDLVNSSSPQQSDDPMFELQPSGGSQRVQDTRNALLKATASSDPIGNLLPEHVNTFRLGIRENLRNRIRLPYQSSGTGVGVAQPPGSHVTTPYTPPGNERQDPGDGYQDPGTDPNDPGGPGGPNPSNPNNRPWDDYIPPAEFSWDAYDWESIGYQNGEQWWQDWGWASDHIGTASWEGFKEWFSGYDWGELLQNTATHMLLNSLYPGAGTVYALGKQAWEWYQNKTDPLAEIQAQGEYAGTMYDYADIYMDQLRSGDEVGGGMPSWAADIMDALMNEYYESGAAYEEESSAYIARRLKEIEDAAKTRATQTSMFLARMSNPFWAFSDSAFKAMREQNKKRR